MKKERGRQLRAESRKTKPGGLVTAILAAFVLVAMSERPVNDSPDMVL